MPIVDIFTSSGEPTPFLGVLPIEIRANVRYLYRYEKRAFIRTGSVKVTTLEECRKKEGQGDRSEGTRAMGGLLTIDDDPDRALFDLRNAAKVLHYSQDDMRERWPIDPTRRDGIP